MAFRHVVVFLCWSILAGVAAAQVDRSGLANPASKPGPKDSCPVCGMLVSKYPNWVASMAFKDGHVHFFDGAKDMFKFWHDPAKYAAGNRIHRREDVAAILVTDFYGLQRVDARKAVYVIGSDVLGPMGHEFIPLANHEDAQDFLKDHKGKRILSFEQISAELVGRVDDGKF
jgi:nitrous oxide reductase accessory protein NosL